MVINTPDYEKQKREQGEDQTASGGRVTMAQALNMALAHEMAVDDSIVLLGEDIGKNGGVFQVTRNLFDRFGEKRVIDTPLDEITIAGSAIGMAVYGMKPIAEFQFSGFMYPAFDQIVNHATRMRNRTRGRLTCPLVFRAPYGGGVRAPEHHSESPEALYAHIAGVRVVIPSSPARAYGLLLSAIRDPDPVIFLEPKRMYGAKEKIEDTGEALSLDTAFVLRKGSDITFVSWGAMLIEVQKAADELEKEGIHAEIIDVASIKYLDARTILESVAKTHHCVIVHEAARTCGFGAEVGMMIAEKGMYDLYAPPARVTGYDTIMPLFQMEKVYLPSVERIVETAYDTLSHSCVRRKKYSGVIGR